MFFDPVYLDWAATTPLCDEAAAAMAPYLVPGVSGAGANANANSLHGMGRSAFAALEDARMGIARAIGASRPSEVVFTSGATESNNAAVMGLLYAAVNARRQKGEAGFVPHFVTTSIEHDAILSQLGRLRQLGWQVSVLKPDRNGFVSCDSLVKALRPETVLVSVMAANNEVGSVQDIDALCACTHEHGALFHTDATQALGKVPVNMKAWGVDAASFSAHKVCGPKGVGALFLKNGTDFQAQMLGGGQELGLRSGTQNVMGATGFAAAAKAAVAMQAAEQVRLTALRDKLYGAMTALPGVQASVECGPGDVRFLPNIVNVTVAGFESETLILQLDLAGFEVSGGSACSSASLEPSHVLSALGMERDRALCSLRISMGRYTSEEDIDRFLQTFRQLKGA